MAVANEFVNFIHKKARESDEVAMGSALRPYQSHIKDLLQTDFVDTEHQIVTIRLISDADVAICLCRESACRMSVKFYEYSNNLSKPFKEYHMNGTSIVAKEINVS